MDIPPHSPEAQEVPRPDHRRGWLWVTVAASLLVGGFLFQDALFSGGDRVVGADDTEVHPFLWGFFWMAQSILEEHSLPYHTTLLDYPWGGVLWLKEPVLSLVLLPVAQLFGIPLAFTLAGLIHTTLGVVSVFGLSRALGAAPLAALLAGLTYGYCPHVLGEAYNGNLDAMNVGWAPLWLWAMVRCAQTPGAGGVATAAVALWLLLVGNQYYAVAMAMTSGLVLLAVLAGWAGPRPRLLPAVGRVTAAVSLGALTFAPLGWLLRASLKHPDRLTLIDAQAAPTGPPYVSDILHLVRPMAEVAGDAPQAPFQDLVYPGLLLVALAVAAPLVARGRRRLGALLAITGLTLVVLSLGAFAWYDGAMVGDEPLWLPWHYLIEGKPIVGSMSLPHRMAVPAGLFLSVAAALSLGAVVEWGAGGRGRQMAAAAITVALGLGALAEQIFYPPYDIPLKTTLVAETAHARLLRGLAAPGAVLNLPVVVVQNRLRIYVWYQAVHHRPIDCSMRVGRWSSITHEIPFLYAGVAPLLSPADPPRPVRPPDPGDPWGVERLRSLGYGFVVYHQTEVHPDCFPTDEADAILQEVLGAGLVLMDGTVVFALDPEVSATLEADARRILGDDEVVGMDRSWPALIHMVGALADPRPQKGHGPRAPLVGGEPGAPAPSYELGGTSPSRAGPRQIRPGPFPEEAMPRGGERPEDPGGTPPPPPGERPAPGQGDPPRPEADAPPPHGDPPPPPPGAEPPPGAP